MHSTHKSDTHRGRIFFFLPCIMVLKLFLIWISTAAHNFHLFLFFYFKESNFIKLLEKTSHVRSQFISNKDWWQSWQRYIMTCCIVKDKDKSMLENKNFIRIFPKSRVPVSYFIFFFWKIAEIAYFFPSISFDTYMDTDRTI